MLGPLQFVAQTYQIHLMEELTSKATDLEIELLTSVMVAMSLLVNLRGSVRIMDSGLERHQFVKVSRSHFMCTQL